MQEKDIVHLVHIFVTGPFLIYVGSRKPASPVVYWALLSLGIAVALIFSYKAYMTAWGQRHVWFAIHAILFSSLLIYVGVKAQETPDVAYSLLLAIGVAAVGYHALRALHV